MAWLISKYLLTASIVMLASELARRSDRLGALVAALPLVTVLVLVWMYIEKQPVEKIGNHAWFTFWYVLPTLPMFLVFPWLLPRWGFWPALLVSVFATVIALLGLAWVLKRFGIILL